MQLTFFDLFILVLYFIISFGLGTFLSRKGGSSLSEYFLSGRKAPWWLAGTSMVATTFAADTPLAVAGIVGSDGVAGNWIWWSSALGGMLTVFLFARLWRRAGVMTDLEFVELRYSGRTASFLRGFKALYFGVLINSIVIGWVNLAMMKILAIAFPEVNPALSIILFSTITVIYVSLAGLWGVAATDMFQFTVAMTGSILVAVFAYNTPGIHFAGGLRHALPASTYDFFPVLTGASSKAQGDGYSMPLMTFLSFIMVQWWASWYPGAEPGGGGYVAQRIMSSRNEREGMFATLWFVTAHYALRPWPWIVAGLAAMVLYPHLPPGHREEGYVYLMRDLLPSPYRGMLLAAFAGAYMSSISTQMNWGASYLVNDFYMRFVKRKEEEKHYLAVAKVATVAIMAISLLVTFFVLETISGAWKMLLEFGAGTGFVLILRWYWWRLNAISELTSMVVPALLVLFLHLVLPGLVPGIEKSLYGPWIRFPGSLFGIVGMTVLSTILVTYLTDPVDEATLRRFYDRVKPSGWGWRPLAGNENGSPDRLAYLVAGWLSGTVFVYSALFFIGSLLFNSSARILVYLAGLVVSGVVVYFVVRSEFRATERPPGSS